MASAINAGLQEGKKLSTYLTFALYWFEKYKNGIFYPKSKGHNTNIGTVIADRCVLWDFSTERYVTASCDSEARFVCERGKFFFKIMLVRYFACSHENRKAQIFNNFQEVLFQMIIIIWFYCHEAKILNIFRTTTHDNLRLLTKNGKISSLLAENHNVICYIFLDLAVIHVDISGERIFVFLSFAKYTNRELLGWEV